MKKKTKEQECLLYPGLTVRCGSVVQLNPVKAPQKKRGHTVEGVEEFANVEKVRPVATKLRVRSA